MGASSCSVSTSPSDTEKPADGLDFRGHETVKGLVPSLPSRQLETFPNPNPERDYEIVHDCPEFTSVCPKTGQPDFGKITIHYTPDKLCVELKSLKLYLWSYRQEGVFFEKVVNLILDDLVAACNPRWIEVVGEFNVRGGIGTTIRATHGRR